jgi:DNA-binding ferritin-like protein
LTPQWLAPGMADLAEPVHPNDHSCGPSSALVTLVEYGDFDCRFCAEAHWVVRELSVRFAPCLRVVFRHSPRSFDHPHAALAAEAAEAAAEQGKFWDMHDCLFEHQGALEAVHLLGYAQWLRLDDGKFADALRARSYRARVRRDQLTGIRSRVISSPAFFINGVRFAGIPDRETLAAAISEARTRVTQGLRERRCATAIDALNRVLALTTALRDGYKRQYWHGLTLPFIGLRMLLGAHTREQTELIECIAQRLQIMAREPRSETEADAALAVIEALSPETENIKLRLACLLEAHQSLLIGAYALANGLAELGDADSQRLIARRVVATNERQAVSLTRQLLSERSGIWESLRA